MQRQRLLRSIYGATFFFTVHYAFLLYIGSTYLSQFFPADQAANAISALYIAASVLAILAVTRTPVLLQKFGLYTTTRSLLALTAFVSVGLAYAKSGWVSVPLFIALTVLQIVIRYILDIYVETFSSDQVTGKLRGIFMTVVNTAIAISPFLVGWLISTSSVNTVYLAAAALIVLSLGFTTHNLKEVREGSYRANPLLPALKKIVRRPNIYRVTLTNLALELFYALMVIYTPLYLTSSLGFSWAQVGVIFSVMLVPFIIIELPAGYLADTRFGEKEMLTLGLIIMGVSTIALAYLDARTTLPWATLLFMTRVGAAFVEIMVDTYFFKKISAEDADVIGVFRSARPIATIAAPFLATVVLAAGTYQTLFLALGLIVLYTTRYSLTLEDTL